MMQNTPDLNTISPAELREYYDPLELARHLISKQRQLITARKERDEKDKELARLRFRVKYDVWPPAGLSENEWEKHVQEWPHAESTDLDDARTLIRSFDAAIRKIAAELTGQDCGGVDTMDEINIETGKP